MGGRILSDVGDKLRNSGQMRPGLAWWNGGRASVDSIGPDVGRVGVCVSGLEGLSRGDDEQKGWKVLPGSVQGLDVGQWRTQRILQSRRVMLGCGTNRGTGGETGGGAPSPDRIERCHPFDQIDAVPAFDTTPWSSTENNKTNRDIA